MLAKSRSAETASGPSNSGEHALGLPGGLETASSAALGRSMLGRTGVGVGLSHADTASGPLAVLLRHGDRVAGVNEHVYAAHMVRG